MYKWLTMAMLCGMPAAFAQVAQDSAVQNLDEVAVARQVKALQNKQGNLSVDVANSPWRTVPDAVTLLARLPEIQLSPDGQRILVVGKGEALLYLDNQLVSPDALQAVPVSDIKTVEIIRNPSSVYQADGKVVLRITRKRSKREGFQTSVSQTGSFRRKYSHYNGLNASLQHRSTIFSAHAQANALNPWESNGIRYQMPALALASQYRVAGFTRRQQYLLGTGITQLWEQGQFSAHINTKFQPDTFRFSTQTLHQDGVDAAAVRTLGENSDHRNLVNAFANYDQKVKSLGLDLFAGLQYTGFAQRSFVRSFNNYNSTQYVPFQYRYQDFGIDAVSGRADAVRKWGTPFQISAGAAYTHTRAQTGSRMTDFEKTQEDAAQYHLKEQTTAAYSEVSFESGAYTALAGIRMEHTDIVGVYGDEALPSVQKNYSQYFPKLQLRRSLDSIHAVNLQYARSISRPNFTTSSQGMTYINPYFAFASNINLNPAVSQELALGYQYSDKSLRVVYTSTKGAVYYGFVYEPAQNLLVFQPRNFDREYGYSLEFTLPFSYGIWSCTNIINGYWNRVEDAAALPARSTPYYYVYSNQVLQLPKSWQFSLTATALGKRVEGLYTRNGFFTLDFTLSKTLGNGFTGSLSGNNIIRNITYKEDFALSGVAAQARYYGNTRELVLSIQYRFGHVKPQPEQEKSIEETSRIK